jgi:threonine dehydrogenase-like Zn-dependent dehydrogenase
LRGVVLAGKEAVRVAEIADPGPPAPGEAVVEVELAGVCGSDLHVFHGRERGLDAGTVLGHEFVGRVREVGTEVTCLEVGMRVAAPFTTSCGTCPSCLAGLTSRCASGMLFGWVQKGRGLHGAQADRVLVPFAEGTLLPIPDDLPAEQAILLGDVLPTAAFAAELAGAGPGMRCAVIGCGPVGLLTILVLRERGVTDILAVDLVSERLEIAGAFGARPVRADAESPAAVAAELTAGRGMDAAIEAVGNGAALRLAFELLRPGGVLAAPGVLNDPVFPITPVEAYDRNLVYRTGRCPARASMERLLPLLRRQTSATARLITHRLPLSEAAGAYDLFARRRGGCVKVVLDPRT